MVQVMESQMGDSHFSDPKGFEPIVFVIDFSEPRTSEVAASAGKPRYSIVVRIEPEDVLFALCATEPESAPGTFAEALAQQLALLAIEKDFPNAVDLFISANQIDHIPVEFENRLPDFCMNENKAWLVGPREVKAELLSAPVLEIPTT
jgi:hypothetical protein